MIHPALRHSVVSTHPNEFKGPLFKGSPPKYTHETALETLNLFMNRQRYDVHRFIRFAPKSQQDSELKDKLQELHTALKENAGLLGEDNTEIKATLGSLLVHFEKESGFSILFDSPIWSDIQKVLDKQ